jgi:DNA recombination protein RmuC
VESWVAIIALLIGLAVGALAAAWSHRRASRLGIEAALASAGSDAQARLAAAEARSIARDGEIRDLRTRLEAATGDARSAADALGRARVVEAGLAAQLRDERERVVEKLALVTQAREELAAHFKALAGDALEVNRQRLTDQHHGALDTILKPLGEKLAAFEKKVEDTYDKEAQQRASLRQEVLSLQAATLQINEDAKNLTLALKGEAKTRGNWGEVVLERVLERSGLVRGREYHTQQTMRDEDGVISRPDIVIQLPDNKHIVIDSKVSLVAYDNYHSAADDAAHAHAGRQHVEAMRRHVKSLKEKNYQGGREIDSPDFVAMFVPIEPAFALATSLDADLFLDAWDKKVVIVTPSTLLALLMTVQSFWQRDKQTRNAIEIAEESGKLHDQFVRVIEALQGLGKQLGLTQRAFELTEKRLSEGNGNLIRRVNRLREMGAKTSKLLPRELIDQDAGDDEASDEASALVAQSTLKLVGGDSEPR